MAPLGVFAKMSFLPHGSVESFEGWVLLRISLGLAVRLCWSDLEKFPKSASGGFWKGRVNILAWGPFWAKKMVLKKMNVEE